MATASAAETAAEARERAGAHLEDLRRRRAARRAATDPHVVRDTAADQDSALAAIANDPSDADLARAEQAFKRASVAADEALASDRDRRDAALVKQLGPALRRHVAALRAAAATFREVQALDDARNAVRPSDRLAWPGVLDGASSVNGIYQRGAALEEYVERLQQAGFEV